MRDTIRIAWFGELLNCVLITLVRPTIKMAVGGPEMTYGRREKIFYYST